MHSHKGSRTNIQAVLTTPATEGSVFKTDAEAGANTSHRPRLLDTNAERESEGGQKPMAAPLVAPWLEDRSAVGRSTRVSNTIPLLLFHSYHTEILK